MLGLDKNLINICLIQCKIQEVISKTTNIERWIQNNNLQRKISKSKVKDVNKFYKCHANTLSLNPFTPNLKEEVRNFLREYVEEFDKDTEQILTEIIQLPFI